MTRHKTAYYIHWLNENFTSVNDFLDRNYDEYSKGGHWGDRDPPPPGTVRWEFEQDPYLGYSVVTDWITNKRDPTTNLTTVLEYIDKPGVFSILVRGMPDSGKTTTVWALAEHLHKRGYRVVLIAPYVEPGTLPDFVVWKSKIFDLEKGDFGIIDEAALKYSNRASMSKSSKEGFITMPVGRHLGSKVCLITQMSSETDIKALRWANIIISKSFESSAMGELVIERKSIAEDPIMQYLKPESNYAGIPSSEKDWSIVVAKGHKSLLYLPKPSFMTDQLSRTYRKFSEVIGSNDKAQIEAYAMQAAQHMKNNGYSAVIIYQELGIRGFWRPLEQWMQFTGEIKSRRNILDLDDEETEQTLDRRLRG